MNEDWIKLLHTSGPGPEATGRVQQLVSNFYLFIPCITECWRLGYFSRVEDCWAHASEACEVQDKKAWASDQPPKSSSLCTWWRKASAGKNRLLSVSSGPSTSCCCRHWCYHKGPGLTWPLLILITFQNPYLRYHEDKIFRNKFL